MEGAAAAARTGRSQFVAGEREREGVRRNISASERVTSDQIWVTPNVLCFCSLETPFTSHLPLVARNGTVVIFSAKFCVGLFFS